MLLCEPLSQDDDLDDFPGGGSGASLPAVVFPIMSSNLLTKTQLRLGHWLRHAPRAAGHLVAIINGASIFRRIIPGVLGDRVGRANILIAASAATGLFVLCGSKVEATNGIAAFSAIFGLIPGAIPTPM